LGNRNCDGRAARRVVAGFISTPVATLAAQVLPRLRLRPPRNTVPMPGMRGRYRDKRDTMRRLIRREFNSALAVLVMTLILFGAAACSSFKPAEAGSTLQVDERGLQHERAQRWIEAQKDAFLSQAYELCLADNGWVNRGPSFGKLCDGVGSGLNLGDWHLSGDQLLDILGPPDFWKIEASDKIDRSLSYAYRYAMQYDLKCICIVSINSSGAVWGIWYRLADSFDPVEERYSAY
jgi:hypothetical protein